jgi:ABC-type Fe3+-hydroxamate transport system substrate-binding protein/adenosylcobinamide amidohydrolase
MCSIRSFLKATLLVLFFALLVGGGVYAADSSFPITVTDTGGQTVRLKDIPKRVVSLVPSATETFFALGAGDLIVGLTHHDTYPRETNNKTVVGGFFNPSPEIIEKLKPEAILFSSFQEKIHQRFSESQIPLIQVDTRTMEDGFRMIELVGKITNKDEEAATKIGRIREQLDLVSRKVAKIPEAKRKRVMRLMGSDVIMTPGDGSFQNDLIRCAGGIPPSLGKAGAVVPVTQEEWMNFNPQVIYYCGNEWKLSKKFFDKPGWKDVEAVRNGNYAHFPCDLTCRASVNMGEFVSWLAGVIYAEELANQNKSLALDRVLRSRAINIDLPYVKSAQVTNGTMHDFPTQTLLIDLTKPMSCLNSLAGSASGITTVGNHYLSPPLWTIGHGLSIDSLKDNVCKVSARVPGRTSFLFTGAKMENLSVQRVEYKDMTVYALVTAGVETNAIRASVDEGKFYEPGTINVIILTNMRLSPRAQTRAIISATEAKSAALQDLDIRSSYSPRSQATGTGTDEVLVVEGRGKTLENAGGHSKLGELIAKAVYSGVKESIALQNGLLSDRSVFQRLNERKIDLYELVTECGKFSREDSFRTYADLEKLLLNPAHAGFLESVFALNTACDSGLVCDLQFFEEICRHKCEEIAGRKTDTWIEFVPEDFASKPLRMALNAFLNGLYQGKTASSDASSPIGVCGK